jgi:hypothetical protein
MRRLVLFLLILVCLLFVLLPTGTSAIVIRHDRDDALYRALGEKYPMVGTLNEQVGCTLIAPRWAITAAHTVEDNPPFISLEVEFGGKKIAVEKVILHPHRVRDTVDSSADMALLKLAEPVEGITPAALYDRQDEPEKIVTLVGHGQTGNGLTGDIKERGQVRGATNKVEGALENSLLLVFDEPPRGTDLEGAGAAGDSGSAALLERDGRVYLVGVSSFNSGDRKEGTSAKYGTFEGFARVSTRRKWILQTIATDPPSNLWGPLRRLRAGKWPSTPFGRRAEAFFAAFNTGREAAMASFYTTHRTPSPEGKTPEERAKGWQELLDRYGHYEVYGYSARGSQYAVLVRSTTEKIWRGVMFGLESAPPFRVETMQMWDATELHP